MKNPAIRPVHKQKEKTYNYSADTHMSFCNRCYERNGTTCCPRVKGHVDMKSCSL